MTARGATPPAAGAIDKKGHPPPARLHALLARDTADAVVICRGRARQAALVHWDRRTDEFHLCQRFRGRVYEHAADLSPDGRHLIYFLLDGRWWRGHQGCWTAIARAPSYGAVSVFPNRHGWPGGGLFDSNQAYWLKDADAHAVQEDGAGLARLADRPGPLDDFTAYHARLRRDGWTPLGASAADGRDGGWLFEKRINRHWILRKHNHLGGGERMAGQGASHDTHALWHGASGELLPQPGWEWAEVDAGRLLWAAGGCIHAQAFGDKDPRDSKLIADLRDLRPA